jgi:hypothetical protein
LLLKLVQQWLTAAQEHERPQPRPRSLARGSRNQQGRPLAQIHLIETASPPMPKAIPKMIGQKMNPGTTGSNIFNRW